MPARMPFGKMDRLACPHLVICQGLVGWWGIGLGRRHRQGVDLPSGQDLVGGIVTGLGNDPFPHTPEQTGDGHACPIAKLGAGRIFGKLDRCQSLDRWRRRTQKADMAQVPLAGGGVGRMFG